MSARFDRMEECLALAAEHAPNAVERLIALLSDAGWRVQYAAAVALGDLKAADAVDALVNLLTSEDAAPIYGQKEGFGGGSAGSPEAMRRASILERTPAETLEAWRRRGRVKQAACLALGEIGPASAKALPLLQKYAADQQNEDYMVRAAACHALGLIDPAGSRETLAVAAEDDEFCTRTEARKALARAPA